MKIPVPAIIVASGMLLMAVAWPVYYYTKKAMDEAQKLEDESPLVPESYGSKIYKTEHALIFARETGVLADTPRDLWDVRLGRDYGSDTQIDRLAQTETNRTEGIIGLINDQGPEMRRKWRACVNSTVDTYAESENRYHSCAEQVDPNVNTLWERYNH